ncbi:MAG: UDP-N-acetylmuramate--L-alanine ligase, partial [Bacteroidales bacterium]|nr:UDP-N-acetylmuramate--L-alanine ligase [Bacteroidales bacterium]
STILSVKDIYPNKKITGIFQPHLFSRTRDFVDGFAQSLDLLDEVILLDIYPAREEPIAGITSEIIYSRIKNKNKIICRKNDLLKVLQNKDFEVVLTLGAGDIDQLILPIKNQLMQKTSIN